MNYFYVLVTKGSDLLDIVVVSSKGSEAAALWVSYLTTCFQQVAKERSRPPFKWVIIDYNFITGWSIDLIHNYGDWWEIKGWVEINSCIGILLSLSSYGHYVYLLQHTIFSI